MADQHVKVVATLKLKPESVDWAIENAFKNLVEESRKEEANISYVLHQDLKENNSFVFIEEWRSQAELEAHMKLPHFVEAITKLKDHFLVAPEIKVVRPLI